MPASITYEEVETELLTALELARGRYAAGTGTRAEYASALRAFNEFIIEGITPDVNSRGVTA